MPPALRVCTPQIARRRSAPEAPSRDDGGKAPDDLVLELGNPPWLTQQPK